MRHAQLAGRQRGAVAVTLGLALIALIGFLGLVFDIGHLFVARAETQNAMDACALASAKELTGVSTNQLALAENAGITVGGRNNVDFQHQAVALTPADISFSSSLGGPYQDRATVEAAGSAQILAMKYAKCTHTQNGLAAYFMPVLGISSASVGAQAVATLAPSQTNCAVPLGICKQSPPPASCTGGGVPDSFGLCPGQWYNGRYDAGSGQTGSFKWLDFSPPSGGASEVTSLFTGTGQCNTNITNNVGQTGIANSITTAWNSRFGLNKTGAGNPSLTSAPPDYTGYSYTPTNWTPMYNALPNFRTKRSAYASYGDTVDTVSAGNTITNLGIDNSYNVATHGGNGQLAANGANRRLVLAPIVDCSGWASSQTVPIQGWACILMLHPMDSPNSTVYIEYEGASNAAGSPCATSGLPAGPGGAGPLVPVLVR